MLIIVQSTGVKILKRGSTHTATKRYLPCVAMRWVIKTQTYTRDLGTEVKSSRAETLVHGTHIYGNLRGCNRELLKDERRLKEIVVKSAEIGNMTLISVFSHKFGKDCGVSIIAIVAESHISIHTWPEYDYATVDVYSCGAHSCPLLSFLYIASALEAREVELFVADRSLHVEEVRNQEEIAEYQDREAYRRRA